MLGKSALVFLFVLQLSCHKGKPTPILNPELGKTIPILNPEICKPTPILNPELGKTIPILNPKICKLTPILNPELGKSIPILNPEICKPTPILNPELGKSIPILNPEICKPTPILNPELGKPTPILNPEIGKIVEKTTGVHKYSFKQIGTIALEKNSLVVKEIQKKIKDQKDVTYYFNEFGKINFLCRFTCDPTFYDFFSSGEIFLKTDSCEKSVTSCQFVSNGNISLESLNTIGPQYKIQPHGQISGYQFISTGEIKLNDSCDNQKGNFIFYSCTAKGTFILVENPEQKENSKMTLPVSKFDYLERVEKYLGQKYWHKRHPDLIQVNSALGLIYDNFDDFEHLCIFTANTIFTTGGFSNLKQLDAEPEDKWCSRGILMLTTEPNYLKMAEVSGHWEVFNNPESVASLSNISVESSLKFYNYLVNQILAIDPTFKITWENILKMLNTRETQPEFEREYAINKLNRHVEYESVKSVLMAK